MINDKTMKLKKGFILREVCGENVIVGEGLEAFNFGQMIVLNPSAAWLWKKAQETSDFTIDSLAESLCEHYDVSLDQARIDVSNIVTEWINVGVVDFNK